MTKPTWKPVGRPTEISPEKVQKLEEVFAIDWTIDEACFYADISKQTYYNWIEKNPDLLTRFEALRNKPVLKARQEVIKWLVNNPEFAMKYLSKKKRDEFWERIDMNHSGRIWHDVNIDDLTVEESLEFIKSKLG